MANPRNTTDYTDIGILPVTFIADASTIVFSDDYANGAPTTMIGKAVTLSGDRIIALCADGDAVLGKLILVEPDGKCHVDVKGFMELPAGASASITRGKSIVGALGASSAKGYIREAASGTAAELVKCRGMIIDNSVSTAVVVMI